MKNISDTANSTEDLTAVVMAVLREDVYARDDDMDAMRAVLERQLGIASLEGMSFVDVCNHIREGHCANFETIRRRRQLVQQNHPELRGRLYRVRQRQITKIHEHSSDSVATRIRVRK